MPVHARPPKPKEKPQLPEHLRGAAEQIPEATAPEAAPDVPGATIEPPAKPAPRTPSNPVEPRRTIEERLLRGLDAYTTLGATPEHRAIILQELKRLDKKAFGTKGPDPAMLGGVRTKVYVDVSSIEARGIELYKRLKQTGAIPADAPDPRQLARAVMQMYWAEWGADLEMACARLGILE